MDMDEDFTHYTKRDKMFAYLEDKTNITFRLIEHPEYFISGVIKEILKDRMLTITLDNKEVAYFIMDEIDFSTIIPSSYNPIRYSPNDIITPELRDAVFKRDNNICKINDVGCTIKAECCDHIIPRSRGGLAIIENLRASCNNCNLKKSNKMPF